MKIEIAKRKTGYVPKGGPRKGSGLSKKRRHDSEKPTKTKSTGGRINRVAFNKNLINYLDKEERTQFKADIQKMLKSSDSYDDIIDALFDMQKNKKLDSVIQQSASEMMDMLENSIKPQSVKNSETRRHNKAIEMISQLLKL